MKQSESIKELATALNKAQSEIEGAVKDSTNPFFKSRYADIHSVIQAIKSPMSKYGLSVTQPTDFDEEGREFVETQIMHSSGEWIRGRMLIKAKDNTPQAQGSAVSYARRYALQAILNVSAIDDDAQLAQHTRPIFDEPAPHQQHQEPQAHTKPLTISEPQARRLHAIKKSANWSDTELKAYLSTTYKLTSTKDITYAKYDDICKYIEAHPKQPQNELGF